MITKKERRIKIKHRIRKKVSTVFVRRLMVLPAVLV